MRDATNERAGRRMTVYVSTIPPSTSDPTQLAEKEEKEEKEEEEEEEEEVTRGGYARSGANVRKLYEDASLCICTYIYYIYLCACMRDFTSEQFVATKHFAKTFSFLQIHASCPLSRKLFNTEL